jgi:hypothetical protein
VRVPRDAHVRAALDQKNPRHLHNRLDTFDIMRSG